MPFLNLCYNITYNGNNLYSWPFCDCCICFFPTTYYVCWRFKPQFGVKPFLMEQSIFFGLFGHQIKHLILKLHTLDFFTKWEQQIGFFDKQNKQLYCFFCLYWFSNKNMFVQDQNKQQISFNKCKICRLGIGALNWWTIYL